LGDIDDQLQEAFQQRAQELVNAGRELYTQGLVPATSGNFSARLTDGSLAITVSGRHKGKLTVGDIMRVSAEGESLDGRRSSAETLLHVGIYRRYPQAWVILHPHSVNATLLSRLCRHSVELQDYEILKAFPGVDSHEARVEVPVFDNDQDIERLSQVVDERLASMNTVHGYLIRGHGFYTWGESVEDTLRHVEAFEFLFDCELRLRGLSS